MGWCIDEVTSFFKVTVFASLSLWDFHCDNFVVNESLGLPHEAVGPVT
jgi:hypothetical protein